MSPGRTRATSGRSGREMMAAVFCAMSWEDACRLAMVKERSNRYCTENSRLDHKDTETHSGLEPAAQQELAIAFSPEDGRVDRIGLSRAQSLQGGFHFFHGSKLCGLVAHNASLAYVFPAGFELRLYQDDDLPSLAFVRRLGESGSDHGGKDESRRDK